VLDVTTEGFIDVPDGRIWYVIHGGGGGAIPLLCLHGGPGLPHGYISSLQDLATERPVIFYDQLGCGRSDRPDNSSLWTVERAVQELTAVRQALDLDRLHIFGSSWGGMLAMFYMLHCDPAGVVSLNLSGSPATVSAWMDYSFVLRAALPDEIRSEIDYHEAQGYFYCPEFVAALAFYYRRHLCRLRPWPQGLEEAFAGIGTQVYETMWGPCEFGPCTGVLNGVDLMPRLHEITVPTLLTIGRYDECPLDHYEEMHSRLPRSELVIFESSSHMQFFEERDRYMSVYSDFLRRIEPPPS
jgi:proline-specific peptidase